ARLRSRIRRMTVRAGAALAACAGLVALTPWALLLATPPTAPGELGDPVGTWYLDAHGVRLVLDVGRARPGSGYTVALHGDLGEEQGVDNFAFDAADGRLELRRSHGGEVEWL